MRNGSSNLWDSNVPKGPIHNETHRHYSKISKFVLATGKPQKSSQKVNKIYKNYYNIRAAPAVMRNGSSNLPDSNVPKGSADSESYRHYSRNHQIGTCNWKILKICEKSQGDAPKCYKLQLLAIVFSINWIKAHFIHLKCYTQNS